MLSGAKDNDDNNSSAGHFGHLPFLYFCRFGCFILDFYVYKMKPSAMGHFIQILHKFITFLRMFHTHFNN